MWRVSDEFVKQIEKNLREEYKEVEKEVDNCKIEWMDLPKAEKTSVCGVDGSRNIEKFCGTVLYAVSSVSIGKKLREVHDVNVLKFYKNIEDRVRLQMHTFEFRVANESDDEIILIDGTLSGAIIRPPVYVENDLEKLRKNYELNSLLSEFISVLNEKIEERKDVMYSRVLFESLEEKYRTGEKLKEDLLVFLEYIEYLHSLDRLLEKEVIFVAKNFYTRRFSKINDAVFLDFLTRKRFDFPKPGYVTFEENQLEKVLPFDFKRIEDVKIYGAFVRFSDGANILMLESNRKIKEKILAALRYFEVYGYPLQLIQAHKYVEIKKKEFKNLIYSIFNALDPELSIVFRNPRDALDSYSLF